MTKKKARPRSSLEAALPGDEDFREPAGEGSDEHNRDDFFEKA